MPRTWDAEYLEEAFRRFIEALRIGMKPHDAAKHVGHSLAWFKAWASDPKNVAFKEAWDGTKGESWRSKMMTRGQPVGLDGVGMMKRN